MGIISWLFGEDRRAQQRARERRTVRNAPSENVTTCDGCRDPLEPGDRVAQGMFGTVGESGEIDYGGMMKVYHADCASEADPKRRRAYTRSNTESVGGGTEVAGE